MTSHLIELRLLMAFYFFKNPVYVVLNDGGDKVLYLSSFHC
jgi:hypothetical protein